jgi:hypothetical protein
LADADPLVSERKLPQMVDEWCNILQEDDSEDVKKLRQATKTGRPVGDERFVLQLEVLAGRALRKRSVGRPRLE